MRFMCLALLLSLISISCSPKELPTVFSIDDNKIIVKLSHMTSKAELNDIQNKLIPYGLVLDYTGSTFFESKRLQLLKLSCLKDGVGGTVSADAASLQFRYYGFIYDLNSGGQVYFGSFDN